MDTKFVKTGYREKFAEGMPGKSFLNPWHPITARSLATSPRDCVGDVYRF